MIVCCRFLCRVYFPCGLFVHVFINHVGMFDHLKQNDVLRCTNPFDASQSSTTFKEHRRQVRASTTSSRTTEEEVHGVTTVTHFNMIVFT